jgi:hypothetical protein
MRAHFIRFLFGRFILSSALAWALAMPVLAGPLEDIKALFESGRAHDALTLARANPQLMGNPQYDYYYGLAAIDSGAPGEGVMALERYLLNRPDSNAARLELGRGYFLMGDNARARDMFEEVKRGHPPPAVRERADEYLAAIRDRESAYKPTLSGFVELGGGHDSNANSGTATEVINTPIFGNLTIDASGREQPDRFTQVAAGLQGVWPVSARWSVFGGISADTRNNRDHDEFDQRNLSLAAGVTHNIDIDQWRFTFAGNELDVDSNRYRTLGAGTVDWQRKLANDRTLTLFAQTADIRYAGDNAVRDSRLYSGGANLRMVHDVLWHPLLSIGVNAGREQNRRDRDDLGRDLAGVSAACSVTFSPDWGAAVTANYQHSRYSAADDLFGARRVDKYGSVELVIGRALTRDLSVRLEASHFDNKSNIPLFQYSRDQVALKLRYDMK